MRCIYCNTEVEKDDNFCPVCGHYTPIGYLYFQDKSNLDILTKTIAFKQTKRLHVLIELTCFTLILFISFLLIRGNDLFRPFVVLKKQILDYQYGYNTSIIKSDNIYNNEIINNIEQANAFIKQDFDSQIFQCSRNIDLNILEKTLEDKYSIPSVTFCDISYKEALKISNVIEKMYTLFPNIEGALTNITITNANNISDYIAYFQPMYQFVNVDEDINYYNKVNKTQILLNSYYFLNNDSNSLNNVVSDGWYVENATLESIIAHEFGHYITFVVLLKEYNLNNITLITKDNQNTINEILNRFENKSFSSNIVNIALNNYNEKYKTNIDLDNYALSISKYANKTDQEGNLIFEETIAEAIHDYYLHGNNCNKASYEIVEVILSML